MLEEVYENRRRRAARVRLPMPLPARLGAANVVLSDVSITGAGLQHHIQLHPGEIGPLTFRFEKQQITLDCTLVRSRLEVVRHGETMMRIYHSGVAFASGSAMDLLRKTIEKRVTRALDRRKSDFYGDPLSDRAATDSSGALNLNAMFPLVAERLRGYIRCELVDGVWHRDWSREAEQPLEGFTISAMEVPADIDLLCQTYEIAAADERQLIRIFARLSVTEPSEVPSNRFVP